MKSLSKIGLLILFIFYNCSSTSGQNGSTTSADDNNRMYESLKSPANDNGRCSRDKALQEEILDTNGDNIADVRKMYKVMEADKNTDKQMKILVCRETDVNHDTKKDVFRYYGDTGRPIKEEQDTNFDGFIDLTAYFENGLINREEEDRNHDTKTDVWIHYELPNLFTADSDPYASLDIGIAKNNDKNAQPKLSRIERDRNFDGNPDEWEYYDRDEKLLRIGIDINFDTIPDQWLRSNEEQSRAEDNTAAETGEVSSQKQAETQNQTQNKQQKNAPVQNQKQINKNQ